MYLKEIVNGQKIKLIQAASNPEIKVNFLHQKLKCTYAKKKVHHYSD